MNITIAPVNGGFIDRILYFNISDKPFKRNNVFDKHPVHLAIVVKDFVIGINLDSYEFYLYSLETNDYYGPYNTYQEMICKHLFGKVDGLFYLLSHISYNSELSVYEFNFKGFVYNPLTYRLTYSVKKTAENIKATLRYVEKPFVIVKEPETVFTTGVIDEFLISLNRIFENDFFPFKEQRSEYSLLVRLPSGHLYGNKASDEGNNFVTFNLMSHRPMSFYIPIYVYPGYLKVVNTLDKDDVFNVLFNSNETKTITTLEDAFKVKEEFGITINSKEIVLQRWNIDKYIQLIIPSIDGKVFMIVKVGSKYYNCEFDLITKTIFLKEFSKLETLGYICRNVEDKYIFITNKQNSASATEGDIYIANDILDLHINLENGIAYNHNEVYALTFLKNLKGL